MAETKRHRTDKKQLGQFMTPLALSRTLTDTLNLTETSKVLEPSFGEGSFLVAIIDRLLQVGRGSREDKLYRIFTQQLYGTELDDDLYQKGILLLEERYGKIPEGHHLQRNDFFLESYPNNFFDFVIGNPPFGGTFEPSIEDRLDRQFGKWGSYKVKKETYSFFIAKSLDLLGEGGTLRFIASDSFMTISTMRGLRHRLMDQCSNSIQYLKNFSDETKYPMVVLTANKCGPSNTLIIDQVETALDDMLLTDNFSWSIPSDLVKYFRGTKLSEYIICTGGMTVGKNEYFVRELNESGDFYEPYDFSFYDKRITLEEEVKKARLGRISPAKQTILKQREAAKETYRALNISKKSRPSKLHHPHKDYLPYNKANNSIVFSPPQHVILWKNDGEAVLTYKKTGNWYLHGVGGQKYFLREGLTWQLISSRINMKYLPEGYILDSGAPCAFLRPGVDSDELWFILGWTLTDLATTILKTSINHTKNIQGKDVERLPYPWWVDKVSKATIIKNVKQLVRQAQAGKTIPRDNERIIHINTLFSMKTDVPKGNSESKQEPLHTTPTTNTRQLAFD